MIPEALLTPFDKLVMNVVNHSAFPRYEAAPDAPASLADITEHFEKHRFLLVSSEHCDNTIFASPEINHAFRAWHDWRHITEKAAFNRAGETSVYNAQCADAWRLAGPMRTNYGAQFKRILYAEILGQIDHQEAFGAFPLNQRSFDLAYLAQGKTCLEKGAF